MAQPTQYQYTEIVGPVWVEPVAEKLAWLPRVQQPARRLPPNRVIQSVQNVYPITDAERLDWLPYQRQPARELGRARLDRFVLDPFPRPPVAGYDPAVLDWLPYVPSRPKSLARPVGSDKTVAVAGVYDESGLEWLPYVPQPQRQLTKSRLLSSVLDPFPRPPVGGYDPAVLDWWAATPYPPQKPRPIRIGSHKTFTVAPGYDPAELHWLPYLIQPARRLAPNRLLSSILDPFPRPPAAAFDPANLDWLPRGQQPVRRQPSPILFIDAVAVAEIYEPAALDWLPRGQQPPRGLLPNRLAQHYLSPIFQALYKPEGLQWLPSDRLSARKLPPNRLLSSLLDPFPIPGAAFDPQPLDWLPRGQQPARGFPPNRLGHFSPVIFQALYRPEGMQWQPGGRGQPARRLPPNEPSLVIIDPTGLIPVFFDPIYFPHTDFRIVLQRRLAQPTRPSIVVVDPTTPPDQVIQEYRKIITIGLERIDVIKG